MLNIILSINAVNLGIFYNVITEKTDAQQEIEGFEKEKVGLDSIPTKSFNAWSFHFNGRIPFLFRHRSLLPSRPMRMVMINATFLLVKQKTSLF